MAQEPPVLYDRLHDDARRLKSETHRSDGLLARGAYEEAQRVLDQSTVAFRLLLEKHRAASAGVEASYESWRRTLSGAPQEWLDEAAVEIRSP